jgi:hypothetical protein
MVDDRPRGEEVHNIFRLKLSVFDPHSFQQEKTKIKEKEKEKEKEKPVSYGITYLPKNNERNEMRQKLKRSENRGLAPPPHRGLTAEILSRLHVSAPILIRSPHCG